MKAAILLVLVGVLAVMWGPGWMALAVAYLLPCVFAMLRKHRNDLAIGVLNLLLGWTMLGWFVALVWSLTANVRA